MSKDRTVNPAILTKIFAGKDSDVNWEYKNPLTSDDALMQAYYKGRSALTPKLRKDWDEQYLKGKEHFTEKEKDNLFRNELFKKAFKNDPEAINKATTVGKRDLMFSQLAMREDLDHLSDLRETPLDSRALTPDPSRTTDLVQQVYAKSDKVNTVRQQAEEYLRSRTSPLERQIFKDLNALDDERKGKLLQEFDNIASSNFPMYKEYSSEYSFTDKEKLATLARWNALDQIAPEQASDIISHDIQDTIASKQGFLDKTMNTGAQFVDMFFGSLIRLAGMTAALAGVDKEDDETWFENFINNDIAKYGDRVATTHSWDKERQLFLEENGLSDNPILNTWKEQNQLLSWNTPFEVIGQYGFTAASTAASFGVSGAFNQLVNAGSKLAKIITMSSKAANKLSRIKSIAKNTQRAKDFSNFLTVGLTSMTEGGMNAADTYDEDLKARNEDVSKFLQKVYQEDAEKLVNTSFADAVKMAGFTSVPKEVLENPTEEHKKQVVEVLKQDNTFKSTVLSAMGIESEQDLYDKAKGNARTSMFVDFIANSTINGIINTGLQSTLHSPSVQKTLKKLGVRKWKSKADELEGLDISKKGASAKKVTFKDRIVQPSKIMIGEAIEEYLPELSSAFSAGASENDMRVYLDYKYKKDKVSKAVEKSITSNIAGGLAAMGEVAFSHEAIKAAVYGALSTGIGGLNYNTNFNKRDQGKEGEKQSTFSRIMSYSPVSWNSSIYDAVSNKWGKVEMERREAAASRINAILQDPEIQNTLYKTEALYKVMKDYQAAVENGDEKAARDLDLKKKITALSILNSLEGTSYHEEVMMGLKARLDYSEKELENPDSVESKVVDQFLLQVGNVGTTESDNPRLEALNQIKKNAADMLDLIERVDKEESNIKKLYGEHMDEDVKDFLVYNNIKYGDNEKRIKSMEEELAKVASSIENDGVYTTVSGPTSKVIAKYGNLKYAKKVREELESERKTLSSDIKELKKLIKSKKGLSVEDIQQLQVNLNARITALEHVEQDIQDLDEALKGDLVDKDTNSFKKDVVISAKDILALDPLSRERMLNSKNEKHYTKKQVTEIHKAKNTLHRNLSDYQSKISDIAALKVENENKEKLIVDLLENPEMYANYARAIKTQKYVENKLKSFDYLKEFETKNDFEGFYREFSKIPKEELRFAYSALIGSKFLDKYKRMESITDNILSKFVKSKKFKELSNEEKDFYKVVASFLSKKEVDLSNLHNLSEYITEDNVDPNTGEKTRTVSKEFLEHLNNNNVANIPTIESFISEFQDILQEVFEVETEEKNRSNTTIIEKSKGPTKDFIEVKDEPTDNSTSTQEEEEQNSDIINNFKANSSNIIVTTAKGIEKRINNDPSTSDETKKSLKDALNKISTRKFNSNPELYQAIDRLGLKPEESNKLKVYYASEVSNQRESTTKLYDDYTKNTGAKVDGISSVNMQYIIDTYPGSVLANYIKNNITPFINSKAFKELGTNTKVFFISPESLRNDVKDSIENSGRVYTQSDVPIIAAVQIKDSKGQLKMQPIAVMPATYNSKIAGSAKLETIRAQVLKTNSNGVIVNEKGQPYYTYYVGNTKKSFKKEDKDVKEFIRKQSSLQGEEASSFFADHLKVGLVNGAEELQLVIGNRPPYRVVRKEIHNIESSRDNHVNAQGKRLKILDLFKRAIDSGTYDDKIAALTSNYRISKFHESVLKVLGNIFVGKDNLGDAVLNDDGTDYFAEEVRSKVQSINSTLHKYLSEHIRLPKDYQYKIVPKAAQQSTDSHSVDLIVTNGTNTIHLATISKEDITLTGSHNLIFEILKNLFLVQNNNKVWERRKSEDNPVYSDFAKFQIDYDIIQGNTSKTKVDKEAYKKGLYNEGIVEVFQSLDGEIDQLHFQSNISNVVVHSDNAATTKMNGNHSDEKHSQGKEVVNTRTGLSPKGDSVQNNRIDNAGDAVIKDIIKDNSRYVVEDDGTVTSNNAEETVNYVRVTDLIKDSEEEYSDGGDSVVRLSIGNSVDALCKDFFEDRVDPNAPIEDLMATYPNINRNALRGLLNSLVLLKATIQQASGKIYTTNLRLGGVLNITGEDGKVYKMSVSGEPDMLWVDSLGTIHIVDFKTFYTQSIESSVGIPKLTLEKYSKQMSLYKTLIENLYPGAKVSDNAEIFAFNTTYKHNTNGTYYSRASEDNSTVYNKNQLKSNRGLLQADVKYSKTESIKLEPFVLSASNATKYEKSLLEDIQKTIQEGSSNISSNNTGSVTPINDRNATIETVEIDSNIFGDDLFGGFDMSEDRALNDPLNMSEIEISPKTDIEEEIRKDECNRRG